MTHTSYPFDSQNTTEVQYSKLFRELQDSGVVGSHGGPALQVFATGGGLFVSVRPGDGFVRGHYYNQSTQEDLAIAAPSVGARIDLVVIRLDPTLNKIELAVIKGDYTTGLMPPLVQSDVDNYEVPLAAIAVAPGVTSISVAAVSDLRPFVGSRVGVWSTATRPKTPRKAVLGLNTTTGVWEYWNGTAWAGINPPRVGQAITWSDAFATDSNDRRPTGAWTYRQSVGGFVSGTSTSNDTPIVIPADAGGLYAVTASVSVSASGLQDDGYVGLLFGGTMPFAQLSDVRSPLITSATNGVGTVSITLPLAPGQTIAPRYAVASGGSAKAISGSLSCYKVSD